MTQSPRRLDITKFTISTPCKFVGERLSDIYEISRVHENYRIKGYSATPNERMYREFLEVTVKTPEYDKKTIVIPDYSNIGEDFCVALTVLFGKRFDNHGLSFQHGTPYIPSVDNVIRIYNKNLTFNSLTRRVDFPLELNIDNFKFIENVVFMQDEETSEAQAAFFYAGRFYVQAIRTVEDSPELAFLGLITSGEILASYFKYPVDDLLDNDTKTLLEELKNSGVAGERLRKKVQAKLMAISASFCKFLLECLDDDFFERSEAKNNFERIDKTYIKQRLKEAYNLRSKYVHAGQSHSGWMSVNSLLDNPEIIHGNPVIEDKDLQKSIKRSPTFIGLERIIRYSLIKFLVRTKIIDDFAMAFANKQALN